MIDTLLGGLGYAGDVLMKPGRAVRGVLGGRPEELAAVLPFSDTLGLTDYDRQVTGHDLLRQMGLDPGDGIGGTLAGIGVDIATDPLTYAGGALVRGLVGGLGRGARTGAVGADEVFDLVGAEEKARDALNASRIDAAFPVPSAIPEGLTPASAVLPEHAGGLAEALGGAAAKARPTEYPDIGSVGHLIGVTPEGAYNPAGYGVAADILGETGDAARAFDASLGAWDEFLGQMPSPATVLSQVGGPLADAASGRSADLIALDILKGAVPGWEAGLGRRSAAQLDELGRYAGTPSSRISSPALDLAFGIGEAGVRPSEVATYLAKAPHLPFDEAALRRLAAESQLKYGGNMLRANLNNLVRDTGAENIADAIALYDEPMQKRILESLLLGKGYPMHGIGSLGHLEPNLMRQLLGRPPTRPPLLPDEIGDGLAEARALLADLRRTNPELFLPPPPHVPYTPPAGFPEFPAAGSYLG